MSSSKMILTYGVSGKELAKVDTVIITDTLYLPSESNTVSLTLSDLIAMDSAANAARTEDPDSVTAGATAVNVSTDRSDAALQALGNGVFNLTSSVKPDTVILRDTTYLPSYITEKEKVPVPVHELYWWQKGLCAFGIIFLLLLIWSFIQQFLAKRQL